MDKNNQPKEVDRSKIGRRNRINGARLELRLLKHLNKLGYFAIRSSGSHSPIDIIAIPTNQLTSSNPGLSKTLLIQVTSGTKGSKEISELVDFSKKFNQNFSVQLWTIKKRGRIFNADIKVITAQVL